jgi:hypothetical protein
LGQKKDDGPAGNEEGKLGLGPQGKGRRVGEGFVFLTPFSFKTFSTFKHFKLFSNFKSFKTSHT